MIFVMNVGHWINKKVDIGDPVRKTGTDASEYELAMDTLEGLFKDDRFGCSGHRNESAVNALICLHALGYDAAAKLWEICEDADLKQREYFKQHIDRVAKYLDCWGGEGEEGKALDYLV